MTVTLTSARVKLSPTVSSDTPRPFCGTLTGAAEAYVRGVVTFGPAPLSDSVAW